MNSELTNDIQILAGTEQQPRVMMRPYELSPEVVELVAAAHRELSGVIAGENDGDELWGYYPGYPNQNIVAKHPLPNCANLEMVLTPFLHNQNLELAGTHLVFVRLCLGAHYSEGLHVDADDDSAVIGDSGRGDRDVFKFILNLHPTAEREFRYVPLTPEELSSEHGIYLNRDAYDLQNYSDLARVPWVSVAIPPFQDNLAYGISFLSNTTLHSGNDHQDGHFLVAYAKYCDGLLL